MEANNIRRWISESSLQQANNDIQVEENLENILQMEESCPFSSEIFLKEIEDKIYFNQFEDDSAPVYNQIINSCEGRIKLKLSSLKFDSSNVNKRSFIELPRLTTTCKIGLNPDLRLRNVAFGFIQFEINLDNYFKDESSQSWMTIKSDLPKCNSIESGEDSSIFTFQIIREFSNPGHQVDFSYDDCLPVIPDKLIDNGDLLSFLKIFPICLVMRSCKESGEYDYTLLYETQWFLSVGKISSGLLGGKDISHKHCLKRRLILLHKHQSETSASCENIAVRNEMDPVNRNVHQNSENLISNQSELNKSYKVTSGFRIKYKKYRMISDINDERISDELRFVEHQMECKNETAHGIILKEMLHVIDEYENRKKNVTCFLKEMGHLASKMSSNVESSGIGYIYRHDNRFHYTSRIKHTEQFWFDRISQLEHILNDEKMFSLISEEELIRLANNVICLKQKIAFILKSEDCSDYDIFKNDDMNRDFTESITDIIDFCDKYWENFLLQCIKAELDVWETRYQLQGSFVNFNDRRNNYFICRILHKIGKYLYEIIKYKKINISSGYNKDIILLSLSSLHGLFCDKMVSERITNQNDDINSILSRIKWHLNELICKENDSSLYVINYEYEDFDRFKIDIERLEYYFPNEQEFFKEIVDDLFLMAYKLIMDRESSQEKLKEINSIYNHLIKRINHRDVVYYPSELSLKRKKQIIHEIEKIKNKKIELIRSEIEYIFSLMENLMKPKLNSFLHSLSKDAEERNHKVINLTENKDKTRRESLLDKIFFLLYKCETTDPTLLHSPEFRRLEYVVQHSIIIINHLILAFICKYFNSSPKLSNDISHLKGISPRQYLKAKGLDHDLYTLDREDLYFSMKRILKVFDYIKSMSLVMFNDKTLSVEKLLAIEKASRCIGLNDYSIRYLQQALKQLKVKANEVIKHKFDKEYLEIFGNPRTEYQIHKLLISAHIESLEIEEAFVKLKEISNHIPLDRSCKCNNLEIKQEINFLYCHLGRYFLFYRKDYKQASSSFQTACRALRNDATELLKAKAVLKSGNWKETKRICNSILQREARSIDKIESLRLLMLSDLMQLNLSNLLTKVRHFVFEMQLASERANTSYILETGRHYSISDINMMNCRLILILIEDCHCSLSWANVNKWIELDNRTSDIMNQLDENRIGYLVVAQFYAFLCRVYCFAFLEQNSFIPGFDKCLETARTYFDISIQLDNQIDYCRQLAIQDLIRAYHQCKVKFSVDSNMETQTKYLLDALYLAVKYDMIKWDSLSMLGLQYLQLAGSYDKINDPCFKQCSNLPVKYYEDAIVENDERICQRAMYKQIVGLVKWDLHLVRDAFEVLNSQSTSELNADLDQWKSYVKYILMNIRNLMKEILTPSTAINTFCNYSVNYFHNKWSIEIYHENDSLKWANKGELSTEELMDRIRMELNVINDLQFY